MVIKHSLVPSEKDVSLHCASLGAGPLILFLHGFPEFWYQWRKQLEHFGKSGLAAAPDLRGYGGSSKPVPLDSYRISELVEDVRKVAEHYSKETFVLVGHDWGGVIAFAFAAKYPALLRHLVVINAPHPLQIKREILQNKDQKLASAYMHMLVKPEAPELLREGDFAWLVENCLARSLKKGLITPHDIEEYKKAWAEPGALFAMTQYYRAIYPELFESKELSFSPNWFPGISSLEIKVPTTVIWGEWDRALLPGNLLGLEKLIPHLQIHRVPEATHWIVTEKPELINSIIDKTLTGNL